MHKLILANFLVSIVFHCIFPFRGTPILDLADSSIFF